MINSTNLQENYAGPSSQQGFEVADIFPIQKVTHMPILYLQKAFEDEEDTAPKHLGPYIVYHCLSLPLFILINKPYGIIIRKLAGQYD